MPVLRLDHAWRAAEVTKVPRSHIISSICRKLSEQVRTTARRPQHHFVQIVHRLTTRRCLRSSASGQPHQVTVPGCCHSERTPAGASSDVCSPGSNCFRHTSLLGRAYILRGTTMSVALPTAPHLLIVDDETELGYRPGREIESARARRWISRAQPCASPQSYASRASRTALSADTRVGQPDVLPTRPGLAAPDIDLSRGDHATAGCRPSPATGASAAAPPFADPVPELISNYP